jgi:hypothetical protein
MKEKGRKFSPCPELCALCYHFLPGPFFNRKEVFWQRYKETIHDRIPFP